MEKKNSGRESKVKDLDIDRFLRHLEQEGEMLDDHGRTIVGGRDRPPQLEEVGKK
jgi:hypothetical protein